MKYFYGILFLLFSTVSFAQTDSINNGKSARDSVIYTHLKESMSKHRLTHQLYNFLFRDVYNQTKGGGNESKVLDVSPFLPYEGKVIGKITVKNLDVFGPSVYDTTRKGNRLERFASHTLHKNTRAGIIFHSFLLFKEGDKLSTKVMEDNERLLRKNPAIHDARILVVERTDVKWMVDILILVQDIWSLNVDGGFNSFHDFGLGLEDINFGGYGHSFRNYFHWNQNDPYQKFQFGSRYTIPYVAKTFITAQAEFIWERNLHREAARLFRPFITTETKYAGAFELGHQTTREFKYLAFNNKDSLLTYQVSDYYYDMWLGRAFKVPWDGFLFTKNARIILAGRISSYKYTQRPVVTLDTNRIYWNRHTYLFSIGYSDRNYRRDLLIYGFGRTEDVPTGALFSLTGGVENTEFGKRGYGGIQYARGDYLTGKNGYLYTLINAGSYIKSGEIQQGVASAEADYISPLLRLNNHHFRHFITLKYTRGFNRDALDYLNISNREGITGINSDYLRGDKRLTLGIESVMFSPKSIVGFRVASFVFANFGLVSLHEIPLISSPVYQAYGIGFRLRNENLTFNTFQIRLGFYPNIPMIGSPFRYGIDGVQPLHFRDFDITAPTIVPLQ